MENVKTFAWDVTLENDSLIVNEGAILGATAGNTNTIGYKGNLSVFGTLQGAVVQDFGYIGVSENGVANFVGVNGNGTLEAWANADVNNAAITAGGVAIMNAGSEINVANVSGTAALAGNLYLEAGAIAADVTVGAFGQFHIDGVAFDTVIVADGYAGVGFGGIADDAFVAGKLDVFAGGVAEDIDVVGGVATAFAGASVITADVWGNGQLIVAGGAILNEAVVSGFGDITLYAGANITGDIVVEQNGAINTWGGSFTDGAVITFEFDGGLGGASITDKARLDELAAVNGAIIEVEVESDLDAGRYLIAGNAAASFGGQVVFTDGDIIEGTLVIGGAGVFANNKTYNVGIDANDNLYLDVQNDFVLPTDYISSNTYGAGSFGLVGDQMIWTNADESSIGIAGMGTYATAGEFAGVGDFNGDGIDDILFANGNDLNVLFMTNADTNADGIFDAASVTYAGLLTNGTMEDFQIGDFDANNVEEIYIKRAEGFYDVAYLTDGTNYAATIVDSTTSVVDSVGGIIA